MVKKPKGDDWATPKAILRNLNERPHGFRLASDAENHEHMVNMANAGDQTAQRHLIRQAAKRK